MRSKACEIYPMWKRGEWKVEGFWARTVKCLGISKVIWRLGQRKKAELEAGNPVEGVALIAKARSDQFLEYQNDCHVDLVPAELSVHSWIHRRSTINNKKESSASKLKLPGCKQLCFETHSPALNAEGREPTFLLCLWLWYSCGIVWAQCTYQK